MVVRYERLAKIHVALLTLACAIVCGKQLQRAVEAMTRAYVALGEAALLIAA